MIGERGALPEQCRRIAPTRLKKLFEKMFLKMLRIFEFSKTFNINALTEKSTAEKSLTERRVTAESPSVSTA